MAMMTLLLAAEDVGLGALLFGVFRGEPELRAVLNVPTQMVLLGAIALGWPAEDHVGPGRGEARTRPRRAPAQILHRGSW